jgi:hypothetical protein
MQKNFFPKLWLSSMITKTFLMENLPYAAIDYSKSVDRRKGITSVLSKDTFENSDDSDSDDTWLSHHCLLWVNRKLHQFNQMCRQHPFNLLYNPQCQWILTLIHLSL